MSASVRVDGVPEPLVFESVVGHVVVAVLKKEDGSLIIERASGVNAEPGEDGEIVLDFIKSVDAKLSEVLPQEEVAPEPKLWLPS